MKLCIYCNHNKSEGEFSDEHIWPDALGGGYLPAFWRTDEVCARCNNLSGLYVDGSFIKSWAGAAERATGALEYLSRASLGNAVLPLNFHGQLPDAPISEGELAEYWSGPCGANVVHIRPADKDDDWSTYAGGDPRAKKLAAGRAYIALTSDHPFWIAVSLNSFRAHFRKAQRFVTNAAVPAAWSHLVQEANRGDPVQAQDLQIMAMVQNAALPGQPSLLCTAITGQDLGTRLLAKLALAVGYKLFGQAFLGTTYAATLRQGLWERDPNARKAIPVHGSGYLNDNVLKSVPLSWPGGWTLLVNRTTAGLSLSVFSPSARAMHVLVSDDPSLLGMLDDSFDGGKVWLTVPSCGAGLGPIWLPDYLAHQLGNVAQPDLAALNSKRCDPRDLPPCKTEDLSSAVVHQPK